MRRIAFSLVILTALSVEAGPLLRSDGEVHPFGRAQVVPAHGSARIEIRGASSLRLLLEGTKAGSILRVRGEGAAVSEPFETADGATWTPTVAGTTIVIESDDAQPFTITKAVVGDQSTNASSSCLRDVACTGEADDPEVEQASRAIALLRFVRGTSSYVCTGALVQDETGSGAPFLITARHCISTPEEAASIEAVWDARSPTCGTAPAGVRTYGAELLVASAETDVALLRLRRIPANRVFLTIERNPIPDQTRAFRLSHGDGAPLQYSEGMIWSSSFVCPLAPRSKFIYSSQVAGGVSKGSSGAPLILPGLRIAGQLLGVCGSGAADACAITNDTVDGSLAASWPILAPHLASRDKGRRRSAGR